MSRAINPKERYRSGVSVPLGIGLGVVICLISIGVSLARHPEWMTSPEKIPWFAWPWGGLVFVFAYIIFSFLFIPGSILTMAAGLLYGLGIGSLVVSLAATLAATLAFLLARYIARGWATKQIEKSPSLLAFNRQLEVNGWKVVALIRLSPLFPFNALNFAFGLSPIPLWHFILATAIGMFPGIVFGVYLGVVGKRILVDRALENFLGPLLFTALAAVALVYIGQLAKRAIRVNDE